MKGDQPGGPIRWRIHIPVPPERVFSALSSDEGRAAFWANSAVEKEGFVHFVFPSGERCSCRILESRPPLLFALDYFGAPARFELAADGGGGTDLLLTQDGIAADEWNEVHAGWLNVLFPLKAWLAHGIDLRNHDPRRTWEQGYADQ